MCEYVTIYKARIFACGHQQDFYDDPLAARPRVKCFIDFERTTTHENKVWATVTTTDTPAITGWAIIHTQPVERTAASGTLDKNIGD
uniref:Uncharacterized protein n=1 Tax=viral metagenome TaxID=1070528 RepID=A0A6C0KE30_9ZZZZ